MLPDGETCYLAITTRDARFDGVLFVGVVTTKIYCRPVCPARTPRRENCRFFATTAEAREAGFRACRRCHPDGKPADRAIMLERAMTYYDCMESPIGPLVLTADADGLTGVHLPDEQGRPTVADGWERDEDRAPLAEAKRQLADYFAGRRREFQVSLSPAGTPFQRRVWEELQRIPFGTTISYGDLARRIGNPNASRAVGLANGRNPLAVIVPCHRVIGANGRLVGYGGGLPIKEALLDFEARVQATGAQPFPRVRSG